MNVYSYTSCVYVHKIYKNTVLKVKTKSKKNTIKHFDATINERESTCCGCQVSASGDGRWSAAACCRVTGCVTTVVCASVIGLPTCESERTAVIL